MNDKVKECFTSHVLMRSLFGLGLGILLVGLIPALNIIWLGPILMVSATVLDMVRK